MTPWIQVYSNLPSHRKTCKLRDFLGLKANYEAVGLVVCLWSWAAVNSPKGDLTGYSARDLAEAANFRKAPQKLTDGLIEAGFLDISDDGHLTIHDWEEHAALLMDSIEQQKKNTRERVRRHRERQKATEDGGHSSECSVTGNAECNVTGNGCNAPTLPNLTLPNLTLPNLNNKSGVDGDAGAGEADEKMLDQFGIRPGEYPPTCPKVLEGLSTVVLRLFGRYVPRGRAITAADCGNVFRRIAKTDVQNGRFVVAELDQDRIGLLEYAFENAATAGQAGNWNYINGILDRLSLRGIYTVKDAREYDEQRRDE